MSTTSAAPRTHLHPSTTFACLLRAEVRSRCNRLLVEARLDRPTQSARRVAALAVAVLSLCAGVGLAGFGPSIRPLVGTVSLAGVLIGGLIVASVEPAQVAAALRRPSARLVEAAGVTPGLVVLAVSVASAVIPSLGLLAVILVALPSAVAEWSIRGLLAFGCATSVAVLLTAFRVFLGFAWAQRVLMDRRRAQTIAILVGRAAIGMAVSVWLSVLVTNAVEHGARAKLLRWSERIVSTGLGVWVVAFVASVIAAVVATRAVVAAATHFDCVPVRSSDRSDSFRREFASPRPMESCKDAMVRRSTPGLAIETWSGLLVVAMAALGSLVGVGYALGDTVPPSAALVATIMSVGAVVSLTGSAVRPMSSLDAEGPAAMLWMRIPGVMDRRVAAAATRHATVCAGAALFPIVAFLAVQTRSPAALVAIGASAAISICMSTVGVTVGSALHPRLDWSYPEQIGNHPQALGFETVVEMIGWPVMLVVGVTVGRSSIGSVDGWLGDLLGAGAVVAFLVLGVVVARGVASAVWRRTGRHR